MMMGALNYQPTGSTICIYGLSEETYNLGKLQYQALFFQAGIGAFIAGVILAATGELLARLEGSGVIQPLPSVQAAPAASAVGRTCEWCSQERSEERRVGKECVGTCRSGWEPYH